MAEYIERAVCLSILRAKANMAVLMDAAPYFEKAAQMLEKLPAADVAPVVHGKWIPAVVDGTWAVCSECSDNGRALNCKLFRKRYKYCPHCGAKMDGEDGK